VSATADAVVVGAGVIGAAIARELSRAGRRVVVADRGRSAGHGSTAASSAIIRFSYSTRDGVALAWESAACWADWAGYLGAPAGMPLARFHRTGGLSLDVPAAPRARMHELYADVGVPAEDWSADDLRRNVPALDPGRFWPPAAVDDPRFAGPPDGELGASYCPDGGFIEDPLLAAQNLAAAARQHGARFTYGAEVTGLLREHGRVAGVRTADGEQLWAPAVVNAAGPWSGRLNRLAGPEAGITIGVRPLRVEVHQVPAPPGYGGPGRPGPFIADLDLGIYVRSAPGGMMLVGGTEPACDPLDWADDPDQVSYACTAAMHDRQVLRAARRFPGLRVPRAPSGVTGVYDAAEDWIPVYDRSGLPGYFLAMGTSGNQFKNAPVAGQIMAALIAAEESGADHDAAPVTLACPRTGGQLNVGAFSRRRQPSTAGTGTVLG
jgi:sarcosine oxidase subunit beta